MARVLNKHTDILTSDAVYIGRPSKWGNPYRSGIDGTKAEVIAKFKQYLLDSPELIQSLGELSGKDLVCWCAPKPCHGNAILEVMQQLEREELIIR